MKKLFVLIFTLTISILIVSCNKNENTEDFNNFDNNLEQFDDNTSNDGLGFWDAMLVIVISLAVGAAIVYFFAVFVPLKLWYEAWLSGVKVSWILLIVMRWQRVPQDKILKLLIKSKNAGLTLDPKEMSNHYLAGVDINTVTEALIRARNANISIPLNDLATQYLAKVNVTEVLQALIMAKNSGVETTINELASYYLAGVNVEQLIKAKVTARNSNYVISLEDLKEHYLAGGDIVKTVEAYISAKKANLPNFEFSDIAAIDLSNIDVLKAVESAITPRVVETNGVRGVARDGVEVTMKVKITLRAFIKNIIGGVNEETVLARVNEGLATEIGLAKSHYDILENPFELADKVEQKNLQARSAFEIISIDVSDIQIGRDVHSELRTERAHALAEEAKAELIKAEEKVQKAMAAAFLDGKLSVHEYYDMKNTEADTNMRKKLGDSVKNNTTEKNDEHNKHDEN